LRTLVAVTELCLTIALFQLQRLTLDSAGLLGLGVSGLALLGYQGWRWLQAWQQMEKSLQQRAEQQRLMRQITQAIGRSLDLPEMLTTTVTHVKQHLQADRVIIYRLLPDGNGWVTTEAVGSDFSPMLHRRIFDPYLAQEPCLAAYQQGHISCVADLRTAGLAQCYVDLLQQFQVKAHLVLPILLGSELWGLLAVQQCTAPRQWQPMEMDLLQQVADQVAIALQQSHLSEQVNQLNAQLEAQVQERTILLQQALNFDSLLKRITDKVRDSLEEGQILQTAVEELAWGLSLEMADVGLYNLEHNTSTIAYEVLCCEVDSALHKVLSMDHFPPVYRQLRQGQLVQFCSLSSPPDPVRHTLGQFAVLACPLIDEQGVLGDLWLFKPQQESFTVAEIRLIQQVANQCAIALRQSRLYHAAQEQIQALERVNRLKDDFLSTVSHELRTPLSNLRMALRLTQLNPSPTKQQEYIQLAVQECEREIQLITDLLDLQRLEATDYALNCEPIDLNSWLVELLESAAELFQQRQQSLTVEIPTDLPQLTSDLVFLARILRELLQNARKYTDSGGMVRFQVRVVTDGIEFRVANSTQISEEELPHLFDKFYRIPQPDRWREGGTGLGLSLVQEMVRRLQGTIVVASQQGWTTVTVTIPLLAM
jgi:signal transduction histidine kinase